MSYLNLLNEIYEGDELLRSFFLKEMNKLNIQVNNFEEVDRISSYPEEYIDLISKTIVKFKHFGTIDSIIYSLGRNQSSEAFEWLSTSWLDKIQNSPIYNENAMEYYNKFKLATGDYLTENVSDYISEMKQKATWTTFQTLTLCTPRDKVNELYLITNKYDVDKVTEALIFLSKNSYYYEVVDRIIVDLIPLVKNENKYENIFIYLSKNIVSDKFTPYLEEINDKNKKNR